MKRIGYILTATICAFLMLYSCAEHLEPQIPFDQQKNCIVLRLGSAPLSATTKAGSERGINYNENVIESVDLFFYPNGGTESNAIMTALGRGVTSQTEADSTVFYTSVHYTETQAAALFGSTTSGTCQVYVIANANINYGGDTRVEALKQAVIERDFSMAEIQNSFVMSSVAPSTVTQQLNVSDEPYASGRVPVSRCASKAQLYLRFLPEIPDGSEPTRVWRPDIDGTHGSQGVYVDFLNGSKKGCIDANYTTQEADYINTLGRGIDLRSNLPAPYPAISADYDGYNYAITSPFYTFPIVWSDINPHACCYIIHVPWYPVDNGVAKDISEYRTYQVSANVVGLKMERNYCYRTYVYIRSLGGVDVETFALIPECDYYICPWNFESSGTGGTGIVAGTFADYKYLVIDNPNVTLNNETEARFTYVSSSNISSVIITKLSYYNNSDVTPKQVLERGATGFSAAEAKIGIDTSTPGTVVMTHSLTDALGRYGRWEVWATVTNEDGISGNVHFVQNPSIRLECFRSENSSNVGNVFVDGHFSRVADASFGYRWQNTSNPGRDDKYYFTSRDQDPGNHYSVGEVRIDNGGNVVQNGGTVYNYTQYGSISKGKENNENPIYTTEVNVSSFNTGNNTFQYMLNGVLTTVEYRIGDPRVKASSVYADWSLYPYLSEGTGKWNGTDNNATSTRKYGFWESPGDIMIASPDRDMQDVIAPRFLVSSNLNGQGTKANSYLNTVKRAATYQEAGYPAGRWRLPTEAEVAFMYARVLDGTIPELFGGSSGYYVASELYLNKKQTGDTMPKITALSGNPSARFVYDLWYWGDEPQSTNEYHPNGHLNN